MNERFFFLLIMAQSDNVHLSFTCENEVREYCRGKASSASYEASLQDQTIISKKSEDGKLLEENIEQEIQIASAHKADDWDHIRASAENPLIITWRSDLHLFLSWNPA